MSDNLIFSEELTNDNLSGYLRNLNQFLPI